MRLLLFIFSLLLLFKQATFAQNNSCKCSSNEKELKQIETLFAQKEYDSIDDLIAKIPTNKASCKLLAMCYQLQLYLVNNKTEKADSIS
jgi:hypothetical protein